MPTNEVRMSGNADMACAPDARMTGEVLSTSSGPSFVYVRFGPCSVSMSWQQAQDAADKLVPLSVRCRYGEKESA